MPRIVIFANGELRDIEAARTLLHPDDYLIAADGGANHLLQMGILPEVVIGDLDSISDDTLFELTSANVKIEQYSEDKDETDLELALRFAIELSPVAILVVGALGGRLDQTIANLTLFADPTLSISDVRLDDGVEEVLFCRPSAKKGSQVEVRGKSGDLVSLIPWGGQVEGVSTGGLKWPLYGETLYSNKSRGVSNMMLDDVVSIEVETGLLLVVHTRKS